MGRRRKSSAGSDEESKKENRIDKATSLKNAATANARERARMQVLSKAFVKLKTTLPWVPPDTKLSKLDTLRLATSYIAHLRQILAEDEADELEGAAAAHDTPVAAVADTSTSSAGSAGAASPTSQSSSAASVHPISFTWPYSFHGRAPNGHDSSDPKTQLSCGHAPSIS